MKIKAWTQYLKNKVDNEQLDLMNTMIKTMDPGILINDDVCVPSHNYEERRMHGIDDLYYISDISGLLRLPVKFGLIHVNDHLSLYIDIFNDYSYDTLNRRVNICDLYNIPDDTSSYEYYTQFKAADGWWFLSTRLEFGLVERLTGGLKIWDIYEKYDSFNFVDSIFYDNDEMDLYVVDELIHEINKKGFITQNDLDDLYVDIDINDIDLNKCIPQVYAWLIDICNMMNNED